jgi:hypothetical protein
VTGGRLREVVVDVRMEQTDGLGTLAEVLVGGTPLWVCDGISPTGRRTPPGLLEDVKFAYVTDEGFEWADARRGNPMRKRDLIHQRQWSYVGFGRVVEIMPVVVDFGMVRMEDANWTNDESLIGAYVRVDIDRLEIVPA